MGRKKKELDEVKLAELRAKGASYSTLAKEFGVSVPTIARRCKSLPAVALGVNAGDEKREPDAEKEKAGEEEKGLGEPVL